MMRINFNLGSVNEYCNLLQLLKNNAQIRLSNVRKWTENPKENMQN